MRDLIVVAHATERKYLLDEYEGQLREAQIDFHLEDVSPLPDGIGSMTMRWRLNYWKRMCKKFADYDRIVFSDAWDVLFYGNKWVTWRIPPFLMSAERNCWPDESLSVHYKFRSPWRFPNPGMMAGYPEYISAWIDILRAGLKANMDVMDQLAFCQLAANHPELVPLDVYTSLFYVVSADKEDGSLRHLSNTRYGTRPYFFHFAGTCHPDPFRAMLSGEVDCLK